MTTLHGPKICIEQKLLNMTKIWLLGPFLVEVTKKWNYESFLLQNLSNLLYADNGTSRLMWPLSLGSCGYIKQRPLHIQTLIINL